VIRAVIRCECSSCARHAGRCRNTPVTRAGGGHPIAMHAYRGARICHLCLNAFLELHSRRLYSNSRTWLE